MNTTNLKIEGMHCQSCVARVKRTLEKVDGVTVRDVQIGSASIETANPDAAVAAVTNAGYPAVKA